MIRTVNLYVAAQYHVKSARGMEENLPLFLTLAAGTPCLPPDRCPLNLPARLCGVICRLGAILMCGRFFLKRLFCFACEGV